MAEQLIRMLKLMAGPEGSRHPKKHYVVSEEEAQQLVEAGAAEIVRVPNKRPPVETATRQAPENADARPDMFPGPRSAAVETRTDPSDPEAERRARYRLEAVAAGVPDEGLDRAIDDRLLHDMLVADGADAAAAAREIWGPDLPQLPWIPQLPTDPSSEAKGGKEQKSLSDRTRDAFGRGGRRGGAK